MGEATSAMKLESQIHHCYCGQCNDWCLSSTQLVGVTLIARILFERILGSIAQ